MKVETLNSDEAKSICDNITLTDLNEIQPYGVLLALNLDLSIIYFSENITSFLDTSIDELLSQPITHFLKTSDHEENLTTFLNNGNKKYTKMLWQSKQAPIPILVYISQMTDYIILEIEHVLEPLSDDSELINLTQYAIDGMKHAMNYGSVIALAQETCEIIKKITSYNRVIIYQFDEQDQSGIVIGEVVDEGIDSYMGLHFPATDIPCNVRKMYLNQSLRYIPSNKKASIKIIPNLNAAEKISLDLSYINLRKIAPVHVQYMENMETSASISVPIIQNNKLWGLIACHNQDEKFLSLNHRVILLLIANTLATQILALQSRIDYEEEQKIVKLQSTMASHFGNEDSRAYGLDEYFNEMMQLVSASGMSHFFRGLLFNYGNTPENEQILDLIKWLENKNFPFAYSTSELPKEYSISAKYKNKACGLLAIKITLTENQYVLFYRPEKIKNIQWAGNPENVLKFNHLSYSPRDSFERFLQTIEDQSTPWTKSNENSMEFIRTIVINKQLQDLLKGQAIHDPLTSLHNRLYLEQHLSLEIKRASRIDKHLAIIMADLDYFKKINDKFGHLAGDIVLIEISKLLKQFFRGYDYIYRYGGEEFLIILPDTDLKAALQKAKALRDEVRKHKINYNGNDLSILVSLGVAVYPEHGVDAKSIIAAADAALYQAKVNGRDQVRVADCTARKQG